MHNLALWPPVGSADANTTILLHGVSFTGSTAQRCRFRLGATPELEAGAMPQLFFSSTFETSAGVEAPQAVAARVASSLAAARAPMPPFFFSQQAVLTCVVPPRAELMAALATKATNASLLGDAFMALANASVLVELSPNGGADFYGGDALATFSCVEPLHLEVLSPLAAPQRLGPRCNRSASPPAIICSMPRPTS